MNKVDKLQKKRKHRLRKLITTLLLLVILAGIAYYAYMALKREYTVTYDSYTATTGSISNALSFSGNLSLVNSASYASSSATSVRTVYVQAGQDVLEGDKLVRLMNGETIEAEFDGRVNTVSVQEGDEVAAGDALVQVADFTHMQVTMRVDEYDIGDVAVGQACTITVTSTEQSFESEIASIDYISASGGNVAYYSAVANVDVTDGVYPGMQVSVSIPQEEAENVVILKADALSFDQQNSAYVWMYNDAGELEQVSVEVGVSNGNYVEIKSGLSDGDVVYVESPQEENTTSLLSGLFGGQQMNAPQGGMDMGNMQRGGNMQGEMPDFGSMGGGRSQMGGDRQ